MELAGVKVAVLGLAKSGLASVALLASKGARVVACDAKPVEQLPGAAAELARLGTEFRLQSPEAVGDAACVVVSPGVPADLPLLEQARARGVRVIGEIELAGHFLQGETIGITGSNGKTTTTALVGHLLASAGIPAQVGGNIGTVPATAMVATSRPGQWNVLELSSFQLETIERFRAHAGLVLNVTPDHLDRHHTFQSYADAKARLLENQREGDFAILNADDQVCVEFGRRTRGHVLWFSLTRRVEAGIYLDGGLLRLGGSPLMEAAGIPLRGRHNIENAMAAALAAHLAGATRESIAGGIRSFRAVEHRLEYVRTLRGVEYYNDSKATNVDSTLKAIDAFGGGLWVILGGKDKGAGYAPLAAPLAAKAHAALLIGAASPLIANDLKDAVPLVECGTLERAVRYAHQKAVAGDTVVLAPACASFDQFDSYEHRGRVFKQLVRDLDEKGSRAHGSDR